LDQITSIAGAVFFVVLGGGWLFGSRALASFAVRRWAASAAARILPMPSEWGYRLSFRFVGAIFLVSGLPMGLGQRG